MFTAIVHVLTNGCAWRWLPPGAHTDLALDALEMDLWARRHRGHSVDGLVHHSDRLNSPSTSRCATPSAWPRPGRSSVGSTGDSYDNAPAEAFNSLFKAELVRNKGPWKGVEDLEIAVAEYVDWFNHRRLHGEIGLVPPSEFEADFYQHNPASAPVDALVPSL